MSVSEELARLAAHYGIEPDHYDTFGNHRVATPDTLKALLRATGVTIENDGDVRSRFAEAETAPWHAPLEPVHVVDANGPPVLPMRLPASAGDARLALRIETEHGARLEGETRLDLGDARTSPDGQIVQGWLHVGHSLPLGEHDLHLGWMEGRSERSASTRLVVTPSRCFGPDDLGNGRLWGITAQLYGLRSADDFGLGDFDDLARLAEVVAAEGAAFVGLNPIHSLFPAEPRHIGPYSPSSRRFSNWIHIDLDAVPEVAATPEAAALLAQDATQATLKAARAAELVDYAAIAPIKRQLLELAFTTFLGRHLRAGEESGRGLAFLAFRAEQGAELESQARFDAIFEHQYAGGQGVWSWRAWPAELRDASGPGVAAFAEAHAERVTFFAWLQWLIDDQLATVQARARDAGMPVGLYGDLAVGVHPDGAATWSRPDVAVVGATVGAPPDAFNAGGQNWGLAPFSPTALQRDRYRMFLGDLGWNMRHAGALRIDHAMSLARLFWIPEGAPASEGTYVRHPFDDLVRLVALQSQRAHCMVIGEDLGNVPDGFRDVMQRANLLSYRVLWFERAWDGGFKPPEAFPREALIGISTHDLPTLAGFVAGRDLEWRRRLGQLADEAKLEVARGERRQEVARLAQALREAGDLPADTGDDPPYDILLDATCRYLARSPSALMFVQLEDLLGDPEQPNLPGTVDEHPNWQRRLPVTVDELARHPALHRLAAVINATGRAPRQAEPSEPAPTGGT
jgi:4-alpha-glucanotransferase